MEYPNLKLCIDTSEDDIVKDLYTPCLCWANRFDRGVGILHLDGCQIIL